MFVNYLGTKETFIEKGHNELYENSIVFIRGDIGGNNGCIYTRGNYFADFKTLLNAISYVKGITINDKSYEVSSGGGYLPLSGKVHNVIDVSSDESDIKYKPLSSEVIINDSTIKFGLSDEFINEINVIVSEVMRVKSIIDDEIIDGGEY